MEKPVPRPDFLFEGKSLKVTIDKSIYVEFQKKLLDLGITQKSVLREFTRLIAASDPQAMKFLNGISQRIFKRQLERYHHKKNDPIDKLDHDVLYHLIEDCNEQKDDIDSSDD